MKNLLIIGLFTFCVIGVAQKSYSQSDGFGLGVVLGEPTGLSIKKWTSNKSAFDAAVAWSINRGYLHIHADYLVHSFKLLDVNQGQLPVYFGLGAKVVLADDPIFGARIPFGISYIFGDAPLDLFAEIVPGLNLIPETDFDLAGGIGIRYYIR